MNYYLQIKNGQIISHSNLPVIDEDTQNIEITEQLYNEYLAMPERFYFENGEIKTIPASEIEQERINNLTMTALDFIKVLQSLGLTLQQINGFLDNNLEIKTQLTYCNNVYCGVVKSFVPITLEGVTITAQMVEQAFKAKNGVA